MNLLVLQLSGAPDTGTSAMGDCSQSATKWLQKHLGHGFSLAKAHVLGTGSFGSVFSAVSRRGLPVAVKEQRTRNSDGNCLRHLIEDELAAHQAMKSIGGHPNLLLVTSHYIDDGIEKAYFISDVGFMDLHRFQRAHAMVLPGAHRDMFAAELCSALGALHEAQVVHRDLKPSNCIVFLAPHVPLGMTLKIGDFGCARVSSARGMLTIGFCTANYRAPEALAAARQGECQYTPAVDVWSLGCILAEFACSCLLFNVAKDDEILLLLGWLLVVLLLGHLQLCEMEHASA